MITLSNGQQSQIGNINNYYYYIVIMFGNLLALKLAGRFFRHKSCGYVKWHFL